MSTTTVPIRSNFRKLSANEWLEIVSLAEKGESIPKIAKLFDIHVSVIYRTLKRKGVRLGSNLKASEEEAAKAARELIIQRIKDTKEQDYRFTVALQEMVMRTIVDARKAGAAVGSVADDVKTLKLAIDAIGNGTKNKWTILGLDKDNADADKELPELPIREMTDLEVQAIRDRQEMEDGLDLPVDGEDPELEAARAEIEDEEPPEETEETF